MRNGWTISIAAVLALALSPVWQSAKAADTGPVNFSGMWVHPFFPGIEPPAEGPGPVFNLTRRPNGQSNNNQFVGDFSNPILKPEAAAIVKQHGEISQKGLTYPTPSNRCWPSGVPYIFFQPGMQMLQQQDEIVFIYMRNHEVRHVRLNQKHPEHVTPSWYGDSVAHYEGDSLVIDTVGINADRPYAMVDMFGTPFSAGIHVVERYRMIDYDDAKEAMLRNMKINPRVPDTRADLDYRGKQLQVIFTVEDNGVFTMPWSGAITYEKPKMEWEEIVCADNPFDFFAEKIGAKVPTAAKPDF